MSGSPLDGLPERGVGCGDFAIPNDLADGQYTLVVRSPRADVPRAKAAADDPPPPLPPSKKGPVDPGNPPGKIEVTFYPEGGDLAAGLENRVYFAGRNSLGKPVQLSGVIVTKGHGSGGHDEEVAAVQTTFKGMGVFSFTPRAGETYRLKITSPVGIKDQPALPEVGSQAISC